MSTAADTCRVYVVPRLHAAGWRDDEIGEQRTFTAGRILVEGRVARRGKPRRADYLLRYQPDYLLAVVEAKAEYLRPSDGLQQAKEYAQMLGLLFAYATNGRGIVEFDFATGIERAVEAFPSPRELWNRYRAANGLPEALEDQLLVPGHRSDKVPRAERLPYASPSYHPGHSRPHHRAATRQPHQVRARYHAQGQGHLAERDRLPCEHLVDAGYMSAAHLVSSAEQGVELEGPVAAENSWQAQAGEGFDSTAFVIDWEAQQARCPQGHLSRKWQAGAGPQGSVVHLRFPGPACRACPVRSRCTQAATLPRALTICPRPLFEALHAARQRQRDEAFWQRYARRAGAQGTMVQGNARADLTRRARFIGLAKTHLQHVCTDLGLNVLRLGAWLAEVKPHTTRPSPFAALAPAVA